MQSDAGHHSGFIKRELYLCLRALGTTTIVRQSISTSERSGLFASGERSQTEAEQQHGRAVLFPDDVRCLGAAEQLVVSRNLRPWKQQRFWWPGEMSKTAARMPPLGPALTSYSLPAAGGDGSAANKKAAPDPGAEPAEFNFSGGFPAPPV